MQKICPVSGVTFTIPERDQEYYKKLGVPLPTLCPRERVRRRMAIRNERNLYRTRSDFTGESILTMYHPDSPYKVYEKNEWFSDKWNPMDYGRDVDFGGQIGFFDQFHELQKAVPRANLGIFTNFENSDYCNFVGDIKNSYLCFGSIFVEDCMYGNPYYSRNCVDCFLIRKSELCYECIDGEELYHCFYCQDCFNCSDCFFGYDLKGCRNCFGCTGLRNKKYFIFNKKHSREDYEKFASEFSFCNASQVRDVKEKFEVLKREHPRRAIYSNNAENCTGNYLFNCKGCLESFQVSENEDCSYNIQTTTSRDCYDMNYTEENELCCEYLGNYRNYKALYSSLSYGCKEIFYSDYCYNCKNCFGCIALKNKEFCILNKQYKEDEYREMVGRLVKMMGADFGEFFPIRISPFAYNETVAHDYFPLSKEEAVARGYKWLDEDKKEFQPASYESPDEIGEVPDSIVNETLACEMSGRNYKIMPSELNFYRRMKLPVPRLHFFERLKTRLAKRLPYELFDRKCGGCGVELKSAYASDRAEKILCDECYMKKVY